jgi:uncharacterized membrane protein YebE (DUF533 family)
MTPTTTIFLIAVGLVAYAAYQLFPKSRERREAKRQALERDGEDEKAFWDYQTKHNSIRAKFDPTNSWNEATTVPDDYKEEIRQLNLLYANMLRRRNAWTEADFVDSKQ